ncbi:MAG: hypothetical protein KC584_00120, partial [Nitrospira sp.]|nr:hypothetical protein [Nitrospira sp.]
MINDPPGSGKAFQWLLASAVCALLLLGSACQKAPGTARDQLIYISEEKEIALGLAAFREVLKSAPLSRDPEIALMVNRVGQR